MTQPQKGVEQPDQAPTAASLEAGAQASEATADSSGLSFEASLEKLEAVVDQLERGDLELEASLEAFELGVRLSARCSEQLVSAEQRIATLTREGENWVTRPFAAAGISPSGEEEAEQHEDIEEAP